MKNTWKLLHAAMLCLGKTLITAKRRVLLCFILFSLMIMMEPVLPAQLLSEWKLPEVHLFLCQRYNHHRCPSCCCWKKSWEENQRWRWNLTHSHVTQSYVACVQSKIHFVIPASFATATLLLANFKLFSTLTPIAKELQERRRILKDNSNCWSLFLMPILPVICYFACSIRLGMWKADCILDFGFLSPIWPCFTLSERRC